MDPSLCYSSESLPLWTSLCPFSQYLIYSGNDLETGQTGVYTGVTVTQAMQDFITEWQMGGNPGQSSLMQEQMAIIDGWATTVLGIQVPSDQSSNPATWIVNPGSSLFSTLKAFSDTLVNSFNPVSSPITACSAAIFSNWQLVPASNKAPVDDRQYYNIMGNWVMSLVTVQLQLLQMIQAANFYW